MKLTDQLIARLRKAPMRDDDELRDSLKNWGWLPQLPAIMDERGQVLVGNRRLRLASELGIKSLIQRVTFGAGDEADAGRVALAIASNLGGKAMTPADRRQLSQYLYGERDWSLERIAKALHTGLSKIRDDLKVPGEPKAPGSKRKREAKPMPAHDLAREIVRPYVERGETISRDELAAKHGLTPGTIQRAEIAERAIKQALADPSIKPETLSSSAKEKLDAAIRQHKKRLDQEFNQRVAEGIQKMLEKVLPELKVREAAANRVMATG